MVKSTREGERQKKEGPRARPTGTRLWEEKQADSAPPICSREPMKRDTSVDPTERPNSKFMVPSQQSALTLVASAAAEDSRSQLITSAIAPGDQVVCMESTSSSDQSITSSPSTIFEYTCLHFAPARRSLYSSDVHARTLGALCPSLARGSVSCRRRLA